MRTRGFRVGQVAAQPCSPPPRRPYNSPHDKRSRDPSDGGGHRCRGTGVHVWRGHAAGAGATAAAAATGFGLPAAPARRATGSVHAAAAVPAARGVPHRSGPHRSAHHRSGRRDVRRQRPHVRARNAIVHARRERHGHARADQPHLAARRHERRRRLRSAHGLRRQPRAAAHRVPARGWRHPRARDRQPRPLQVHGHGRRRRVGQARAVLRGLRPRHQHGMAAGRHGVAARQLALHHLQPVPPAHPGRRLGGARGDRPERRPVVDLAGQLRQVVDGRRRW